MQHIGHWIYLLVAYKTTGDDFTNIYDASKMGIFATLRKSISQSLQRVVRYRIFVQEKLTTRRKSTMCSRLVVKMIRVIRLSEIHPWSSPSQSVNKPELSDQSLVELNLTVVTTPHVIL